MLDGSGLDRRDQRRLQNHVVCPNRDRGAITRPPLPHRRTCGPHTAVRRVELCVNSQAFCIVRRQETTRSLRGRPSGLHPYLPPEGQAILGFLPRIVPEIALLTCLSLYSPYRVPFGPSFIVSGSAYRVAPPFGIGVPH